MFLPEYKTAVDKMREKGKDYLLDSYSLVFSPDCVEKKRLVYVSGLYPGEDLFPAKDLFFPEGKDLYKELKEEKELDVFGVSPYGDDSLIDVLNTMDKLRIFVHNMDTSHETGEWKKRLNCCYELIDAKEMRN